MLCPECLENKQKAVRLYVKDSRPDGPYKTHRKYRCAKCNYETWTTEILPEIKKNCQNIPIEYNAL